jgi:lysyl-tRNA synthetase class 2
MTEYKDDVQFTASVADLVRPAYHGLSVRVPGRVTLLEKQNAGYVRGCLRDAGKNLQFEAPASLFETIEVLDLVVLSGQVFNQGPSVVLDVKEVELLTRTAAKYRSTASWGSAPLAEHRAFPEYEFIFDTDRAKRLQRRLQLMQATRHFLDSRGFLEVDTPFLVPWPDIAPVEPVRVSPGRHVRQGDLRIANTEFMRRLLVAGFDRIYQLGRCFRDEEPSWKHEIEFTQLTFGIAYATYEVLMSLIEELVCHLLSLMGCQNEVSYNGKLIDFNRPWRRITVQETLKQTTGIDILACPDRDSLEKAIRDAGLEVPKVHDGYGGLLAQARVLDALIDKYVIPTFEGPTWLYEYPFYLGGPAKEIIGRPEVKMRAELFVEKLEIANISVPQNDPKKVRAWYEEMRRLKVEKGWDTPYLDEHYLHSMEVGIPVATTGGLGFDRLAMVLLDAVDIRDVMLFLTGAQY